MLLYRARSLASRPSRLPAFTGNEPATRVRGRWFTSDLQAAIAHKARIDGPSEIVEIEVEDAIAETFRVSTTPYTRCGLSPIEHSLSPDTDFVLNMFRVVEAQPIADGARQRDYLFAAAPRPCARTEFARRMAEATEALPKAA